MNRILWQIRYSIQDFSKHFINSRLGVFIVLQTFLLQVYLAPIQRFTLQADYPVSTWIFPFLMNAMYFKLFYILGVIYVYSKVPFTQYDQMYQVIRTGRIKWAIGKIIGITISGFFLIFIEMVASVILVLPRVIFETGWGKVIYSLSVTDAIDQFNIKFNLPYEIIKNYTPFEAMGILVIVGGFVIVVIGLLMFALSLYFSRLSAAVVAMFFAILPIVMENIPGNKWLLFLSPVSWLDLTKIASKSGVAIPTLNYIMGVLVITSILLSGLILYKIRKTDLNWNKED